MRSTRRSFIYRAAVASALGGPWCSVLAAERGLEVTRGEDEWRELLGTSRFEVLRRAATERPYTSPLNDEHRRGIFHCAGCALDVFSSDTKFDSRTGWPSFWQPLENAVDSTPDRTLGMARTAVHCRRCGGHLGHVFDDGPKPTGLRYCINGLALTFTPS